MGYDLFRPIKRLVANKAFNVITVVRFVQISQDDIPGEHLRDVILMRFPMSVLINYEVFLILFICKKKYVKTCLYHKIYDLIFKYL